MDKLQVISHIIFDGELHIHDYDTRSTDRLSIDKDNLELTKRAFFIRGLPFLMIVCSFVHKEATFFHNYVIYQT